MNLSKKGLVVEYIGEGQDDHEALTRVIKGNVQLVYMSPESLLCNPRIRKMLCSSVYQHNLVAFVVDEAHCLKMW